MKKLFSRIGVTTCFLMFFILMCASIGLAADDPPFSEIQMGEEALLFQEIPSIFGASKYEQKVTEAPSSISIVTADEIQKFGYRTFADILNSIQGFYTTNDRNYQYLGVRGFGTPGDYNTRILLLIDGHRVNDNIYDSAGIGTDFILDVDLIDRVEIIRGPSSSLYGANAFFGVINVLTKNGRAYKGVEVSAEAASHDTYKARLTYGNRFSNGLDILVSGSLYNSVGDNHYYKEFDDPDTNFGIADEMDGDQYGNLYLNASFKSFTLKGAYYDREKEIPTAPWGIVFNSPNNETEDRSGYLDLKYEETFHGGWDVMARLYYDRYEYEGYYQYDYAEPGDEPYFVLFVDETVGEWWGTEIHVTKTFFEDHKVIFGGEYRDNNKQNQEAFDQDPFWAYMDDKRNTSNWGLFLQDEFQISSKIILNAGIRYDDHDIVGDSLHPRIALIYSPVEETTIKLLYGTAFRAPNFYELYYNDGGYTTKASLGLESEEITTYELIIEQYLCDRFRLAASGYYYKLDDLITQITDPSDDLLMFVNTGEIEAKGFEIEFEGKWENGMLFRANYSYQDSENVDTGQDLINSPEHMVKLNLIAPLIHETLFAGLEARYIDNRKTIYDTTTDDYFVTNLTVFSNKLLRGLHLSASIYNLFDEDYADPGSAEHLQPEIKQDGRTYRFKVTYSF